MPKPILPICLMLPAALCVWATPRTASALLEECGAIELNRDVECELRVEGGCEIACEPPSLTLACSGELYVECQADECQLDVEVDCSGSCTADCSANCDVDPGSYECEGNCTASCEADCDAHCEGAGNEGECHASCEATCSGECSASCQGTPPTANCDAKCEAQCQGQCEAEANVHCQIECQADGYLDCKADMKLECEGQCTRPEGVVICDGQFVDADDVNACVAAIEAAIDIEVEVTGSADADCEGNTCKGEAEGSVSCAMAKSPTTSRPGFGLLAVGALVGIAAVGRGVRRRSNRPRV